MTASLCLRPKFRYCFRFTRLSLPALVAVAIGAGLSAGTLSAAEPDAKRVALFDGKDLAAFDVIGCKAIVQDGAILLESGNGLVQAKQRYGDFVLELDWKALKPDGWDSGIYFRYNSVPKGRPWPERYQANLRQGLEGNVDGLAGAESKGLTKPGEWNHLKLTVVGATAKMEINGKPAWKASGLEEDNGYVSLQAEVPGGGQFLFRDVYITPLKRAAK